ncbi:hypothetical protein ACHAWO_004586 [Cyclotella atomus]|uniref:HSF-type DNA-binding domain-containing protein n=1 Tax=Cyclotella atomus TaxID=382360 RepID=A0ABD3PJH3_9STRA
MELSKISVSPMPTPITEIETKDDQGAALAQFSPAQQLFFRQLQNMLMQESANSNGCVKWLSDSKGFTITDKDVFSENILRRYFGEAKYASFTRRLKRWGFQRITKGQDSGAYYHDAFHRGMSFEDFEDDIGSMSPSESSQILPPKKSMAWSPTPCSNEKARANTIDSLRNQNTDVNFMPEIMREINRSKRCERNEYDAPAAKRTKLGNGYFYGESSAACAPRNYAFSSLEQRRQEVPQDHLEYLYRLKMRVYQENQGSFNMDHAQSRSNLSNVSTDILKREIELRRMQQRLACQNNTNQMHHQSHYNGFNMFNGSRVSPSMNYSNDFYNRSDEQYAAARTLGALKGPRDTSTVRSMHQNNWSQMNSFNGNAGRKEKPQGYNNFSFDSGNKVPIPGIMEEMEPRKNPFNRAA